MGEAGTRHKHRVRAVGAEGSRSRRFRAAGAEGSRSRRFRAVGAADTRRKRRRSGDEVAVCTACQPLAFTCPSRGGAEGATVAGRIAEISSAKESNFSLEGVECVVSPATKLDLQIRVPISAVMGKVLLASAQLQ